MVRLFLPSLLRPRIDARLSYPWVRNCVVPTGRPVGLASWPTVLHVGSEHVIAIYDTSIELQVLAES